MNWYQMVPNGTKFRGVYMSYNRNKLRKNFRGKTHAVSELYPQGEDKFHVPADGEPVDFGDEGDFGTGSGDIEQEKLLGNRYEHPCWCKPELIFDCENEDLQLWKHNRIQ